MPEYSPNIETRHRTREVIFLGSLLMGGFCLILLALMTLFYTSQRNDYLKRQHERQMHIIAEQSRLVQDTIHEVIGDVLYLSRQNELLHYLRTRNDRLKAEIAAEYFQLTLSKTKYDQVRFLDQMGMEKIRVNYNNGRPFVVSANDLQNKSQRHYFTETIQLQPGDIYISQLDLNMEKGVVEKPYNPIIRISTPIFDDLGMCQGCIVINFRASLMLNDLAQYSTINKSQSILLDREGYYILSPDKTEEWGAQLATRRQKKFLNSFPEVWEVILQGNTGNLITASGLFTFSPLYPFQNHSHQAINISLSKLEHVKEKIKGEHGWILINRIPPEHLNTFLKNLLNKIGLVSTVIALFIVPGTWILAGAIIKRRAFQKELLNLALHDPLTGLPNRRLFYTRLQEGIAHAQRFHRKLALLYIDLDGFKEINDTLGHEAGDELLVKISALLAENLRMSDTVARLGGDEFACILQEVNAKEGAFQAARNLQANIVQPLAIASGIVDIGASIGIAVYPDHASDVDPLVQLADAAMYISKASDTEKCTMASAHSELSA
ncbi:sensor domain-containing diguanylate cyclase [Desulfogranum japonicum]|uniref:sensor domain-containing diguanylate cyclase n=1 Tax=Desulfogranum japonicum TaxID=231447 RepID=UPI00042059CF|nr:sensor domain-containing diguanylate cyclase [Desulfogranum japonicum]